MPTKRAVAVALAAMAASLGLVGPTVAQSYYKGKTLRIIVGTEAGGTADILVRGFSSI